MIRSLLDRTVAVTKFRVASLILALGCKSDSSTKLQRLGSKDCGWWAPTNMLKPDDICFTVGAGEDVTFDIELWKMGCRVCVFDPTPRAVAHVEKVAPDDRNFEFYPLAFWSEDTSLRFFKPADSAHVSHSAVNLQRTDSFIEVPAVSLISASRIAGGAPTLIKLDIEGAENTVLLSLAADQNLPEVLLVEHDQFWPFSTYRMVAAHLRRLGYQRIKAEGLNATYVRRST